MTHVAILGCVGIPANYGGYETLAQNLVEGKQREDIQYVVYCSSKAYSVKMKEYHGARLVYCPFKANGWQSPIYDALTYVHAYFTCDTIVTLSSMGSFVVPLLRIFGKRRIIANYDGMELHRDKWGLLPRIVIRISQKCTSWFASYHIADNDAIAPILKESYGVESKIIEYGGDNAFPVKDDIVLRSKYNLEPQSYYFNVARIEPENNIDKILSAFEKLSDKQLVLVGNWQKNDYAKDLYQRYSNTANIKLFNPIYAPDEINLLRSNCKVYIHPHSVGGTNPSLVEAMSLGLPIITFDVIFNRTTTENKALYFKTADALRETILTLRDEQVSAVGNSMLEIARRRYRWATIIAKYEELY
ncbi:DUF1972 domain-containing protein [Alistipes indistinctus]|uniref:DUF1972 domain-containing protein n=1 Tax=Alistipes indistinctus TaxID=626932 RepID=UPI002493D3A5|nr:DUF1972 domain-containing protein [Alistipes indistinctus]